MIGKRCGAFERCSLKMKAAEFPVYAPDLSPDEGVWQHLKHYELRDLCCVDLDHLEVELT